MEEDKNHACIVQISGSADKVGRELKRLVSIILHHFYSTSLTTSIGPSNWLMGGDLASEILRVVVIKQALINKLMVEKKAFPVLPVCVEPPFHFVCVLQPLSTKS